MPKQRSRSNSRRSSLLVILLLVACAPQVEDCRTILPLIDGPITVTQTPLGTTGCSCTTEEVVVVVEARRHYFAWERGQVWIDGTGVTMAEFSTKLDEAKAKRRAERMGAAIERGTRPVRKAVRDLGTTLKNLFK
jgi:hypothetical protein